MSFAALGEAEALTAGAVPIMAAGTVIGATSRMAKGVTKWQRNEFLWKAASTVRTFDIGQARMVYWKSTAHVATLSRLTRTLSRGFAIQRNSPQSTAGCCDNWAELNSMVQTGDHVTIRELIKSPIVVTMLVAMLKQHTMGSPDFVTDIIDSNANLRMSREFQSSWIWKLKKNVLHISEISG